MFLPQNAHNHIQESGDGDCAGDSEAISAGEMR